MAAYNVGLYSNCRKKPYKWSGHAPLIGGAYGLFRGFAGSSNQWSRPSIVLACNDINAFIAQTPYAQATYQGNTVSCWDSDTLVQVSGWCGTEDYNGQVIGGAGISLIASIDAPVGPVYNYGLYNPNVTGSFANGATKTYTYLGWRDASGGVDDLNLYGLSLVSSAYGGYGFSYTVSINGTVVKSGSSSLAYFNDSYPETMFFPTLTHSLPNITDFCRIDIAITNTSGYTWSSANMHLYGSSIGNDLSSSNPARLTAGLWTVDFDAPGITSGDLYRTLTCDTSGPGQTYVAWLDSIGASYATATSTGTHTCELDELCNTWVS
jgi:hypothetical protein